ncbi:NADH dehydrogenase I chain L [Rickettsia prowazekii str. NMRC Madrid E]|nr:NADH dehydrogenase I chain L [Rickettsia prowazekii str. NMRC Madrid E]
MLLIYMRNSYYEIDFNIKALALYPLKKDRKNSVAYIEHH